MGTKDIEQGVRHHFRPGSVVLRKDAPLSNIHEDPTPTRLATTMHDYYHATVMSRIPVTIRGAFLYMVDIARANLESLHTSQNSLLTKEIWDLIDCDFPATQCSSNPKYFPEPLTPERETKKFCFLLGNKIMFRKEDPKDNFDNRHNEEISVVGVFVCLDMLQNRSTWEREYNIYPEYLVPPFKKSYEFVKEVFEKYPEGLSNLDPLKQVFIIKIAERFHNSTHSLEGLPQFLTTVKNYFSYTDLHQMVEFYRIRDKGDSSRNCIILKEKEGVKDAMKIFDEVIQNQIIYIEIAKEESQLELDQIDNCFLTVDNPRMKLVILHMANKFLSSSETDKNQLNSFLQDVVDYCVSHGLDSICSFEEKKSCLVLRINEDLPEVKAMMEKSPPLTSYCVLL